MNDTSIFGTCNYEYIQVAYENMTRRDKDTMVIVDNEDDVYEVNFEETCIDLCEAGFILVNGRCIER